jgi:hypothetical protein
VRISSANAEVPATGSSGVQLRIEVAYDLNPLPNERVDLRIMRGNAKLTRSSLVTDSKGTASAVLAASEAGEVDVEAIAGTSTSDVLTVHFTSDPVAALRLRAPAAVFANEPFDIAVDLLERSGGIAAGANDSLEITAEGGQLQGAATTHGRAGEASFTGLRVTSTTNSVVLRVRAGNAVATTDSIRVVRRRWAEVGPDGGLLQKLAVAGDGSGTVFVAVEQRLYRSDDGASSWRQCGDLPLPDPHIGWLVAASSDDVVVAGNPILRSNDGCRTWRESTPPNPFAPGGGIWWNGTAIEAPVAGGLARSTDGRFWWLVEAPAGIASAAVTGQRVYALTSDFAIWRSDDGGATHRLLSLPFNQGNSFLEGKAVKVVTHPDRPDLVFATDLSSKVWRSADGGTTWSATGREFDVIVFGAGDVVHGRDHRDAGAWVSEDAGVTWRESAKGITALAADSRSGRVYAATFDDDLVSSPGNVLRAVGAGPWEPASKGIRERRIYAVTSGNEPDTFWATAWQALYRSSDAGTSWSRALQDVVSAPVVAARPDTAFVSSGRGVLRTRDGGATWRAVLGNIGAIGVDRARPDVVVLAGDVLARTLDGGDTWTQGFCSGPCANFVAVAFDPVRHSWIASSWGDGPTLPGGSWRSDDDALTWVRTGDFAPAHLLQAHDSLFATNSALYTSADGGANWTSLLDMATEVAVSRDAIYATTPAVPATSIGSGFHKSVDGGATWTKGPREMESVDCPHLAALPGAPRTVLVGCDRGLFLSKTAGE